MNRKSPVVGRRTLLRTGAIGAAMLGTRSHQLFARSTDRYSHRAIELMQRAVVADLVSPIDQQDGYGTGWWKRPPGDFTPERIAVLKSSGMTAFFPTEAFQGPRSIQDADGWLSSANNFIATHAESFMRIDSVDDFAAVKRLGKLGIVLATQNAAHFQSLDLIDHFYQLGQRGAQLTYNRQNEIGSGGTESNDGGVSDFGRDVIGRMNQVGMYVDVSHCGDRTTMDAFAISTRPVLITHGNCRALNPGHPRCKTDEAIKAMAKSGGVMGITNVRNFVSATEPTTVETVLDHYDHVARLVGVEHLAVGSDSDLLGGYDAMPKDVLARVKAGFKPSYAFRERLDIDGLNHPKKMFDLTEGLIRRGYSDTAIAGILGGNLVRVLGTIWK